MTFKNDYNRLLLELLRELVKNALHFEEIVSGSSSTSVLSHIDVKIAELQYKGNKYLNIVRGYSQGHSQYSDI